MKLTNALFHKLKMMTCAGVIDDKVTESYKALFQVFDVYAEFEEQLITLKIEQRTKNGKTPENELDLQMRLRRFEKYFYL